MDQVKMTPKDFFLQFGIIITLYISAGTLLALAFSVINVAFPKVADYYYVPSISWPVATLIIIFPVYLILAWLTQKQFTAVPEKRNLAFRKWLVYITLFISAAALIGDLITVLYFYLDGQDLTLGFLLKALAVLVVAGGIFKYYFFELKGWLSPVKNKLFATGALIVVAGMIVWGFSVIGSPRTQRLVKIDNQKVNHLQQIQGRIIDYWSQKGALPNSLTDLEDSISGFRAPKDPDTDKTYEYILGEGNSFKLCAEFNRESGNDQYSQPDYYYGYNGKSENWQHGKGRHCFDRTIDPELYPPVKP